MGIAEKIAHAKKQLVMVNGAAAVVGIARGKSSTFQYISSVPDRRLPASRDHRRRRGSKTVQIPAGRKIQ